MNLPTRSQLLGYLLTASLSALGACANGTETPADDVAGRSPEPINSQQAFLRPAPAAAAPSATSHWLVLVAIENGQFNAQRVKRVDGPLRQLHDDKIDDELTYVANTPNGRLVAGAPDPRTRRLEDMDPLTRKMTGRQLAATGPQHLLLHVPEGTDRLELFETRALRDHSSANRALSLSSGGAATFAQSSGAVAPIASLSLKGLL